MKITSAKYITSAVDKSGLILDETPEIAFVGRSNVGKSSLINNLVGIKKLAKTSSMPGLTKMVNYFDINNGQMRFVDLPGYGFAKTSKKQQDVWSSLMGEYLSCSNSLRMVFLLVDIRHEPSDLDKVMLNYLLVKGLPFSVVATKADKLSRSGAEKALKEISESLKIRKEIIFVHSSENGLGKEKILSYLENLI